MNTAVSGAVRAALAGHPISREMALALIQEPLSSLLGATNALREKFFGNRVSLCAIVNARSGMCGEDCVFCAQSSRHSVDVPVYPMMSTDAISCRWKLAGGVGAHRVGIVTSGRSAGKGELKTVLDVCELWKSTSGPRACASLGEISMENAVTLKRAGLSRYHHNLETSERFFPFLCSTHRWADRVKTVRAAKDAGLAVCSGGIFGAGEEWEDRVDLAVALRELEVDSVPINFLTPVKGTPLESRKPLLAEEALRIIAIFRFILPRTEIRVAGGRELVLGEKQEMIFSAGANAFMVGDYLTTKGRKVEDDLEMIARAGLVPEA